ncbi:MAG: diacylglycerol kinase family protein [Xanthomarina sp.]
MNKNGSFFINRLKSVGYAFKGAWLLIKTEASIQCQVFIGLFMTFLGFFIGLSPTEWMIQSLTIGLILGLEGLNTAIEAMADFVHPEIHPKIGRIKDLAAGAVFLFAIAAIAIGILIYFPKFF